jgi:hypothetical protein
MAVAAPPIVSRRGRCPCRSQSQATTRMAPVYSMSSAIPTGIRCSALK